MLKVSQTFELDRQQSYIFSVQLEITWLFEPMIVY